MRKKNILITGGTSGIGASVARNFSKKNDWNVIVGSTRVAEAKKLDNIFYVNLDVSSEDSVKKCFNVISQHYDQLDALINSAGYVEPLSVQETSFENWNRTISVNLTGVFLTCKYAIPLLKDKKSYIINIASTAGSTPRPGWAAYAAAKSGVINFTKALVEEVASYGIRCHIISPGRTATPLRKILAPGEDPRSIMQPEKVAEVIDFIINNELDVLEGQDILVRERF